MKKVLLAVHQNYLEDVIKRIHESGLLEIIDISKDEPYSFKDSEKTPMDPDTELCSNYELRLSRLIDILNKNNPKPNIFQSFINPKAPEIKTVKESSLEELFSYAEGLLGNVEKNILQYEQKLKELEERVNTINLESVKLQYLRDFNFNILDIGESKYLIIKVGKTSNFDKLKADLKNIETSVLYSKEFIIEKENEWGILIVSHVSEKEKIEKICRENLTEFYFSGLSGSPKDILESFKIEKRYIENEKEKIRSELKKYAKEQLSDLLAIREEIHFETVRKEVLKNFVKTDTTYIIKGWLLEENEEKFRSIIKESSEECFVYESKIPSSNPDNPPTYTKTPKWASGFKSLLTMFATPKYNEIDPTIIMGFFFVLFFGIMLGDAGYGLVIFILSLFGYFKIGKHSNMIKNWSFMGIWMGLVTTITGFLTNSFFGDLVPRFIYGNPEAKLYEFDVLGVHIEPLVDPIKDPISILIVALIFGLIHLNVGLFLGVIQTLKQKKYKELITTKLCWVSLQIGGGILIGKLILDFQFSDTLMLVGGVLVIIGIIQLFASAGPIGFFNITGYVGDWLSYARLLALGLATAGMALAFNVVSQILSEMIPAWLGILLLMIIVFAVLYLLRILNRLRIVIWSVITIALMIIFLIFSSALNATVVGVISTLLVIIMLLVMHVVNLILQALGAAIHSLRLQYVEFFNRFYEGGGHGFTPFKLERKYTKKMEKKKD